MLIRRFPDDDICVISCCIITVKMYLLHFLSQVCYVLVFSVTCFGYVFDK